MQAQLINTDTKQEITNNQSQALIKDLVSISLHCITFLRNIFGDDNYADKNFVCNENRDIQNKSNSVKTKQLVEGISSEADTFIKWIENGIGSALSLQYLQALQFGIYIDEKNPVRLSETYLFQFDYTNGNISLAVNNQKKCQILPELSAREKVQQLIKRLIVLTQTFCPLPEQKHISVRLLFNEKCPKDYQPPFFKDASNLESPTIAIDQENSKDDIGSVNTGYNSISIKVLSNVGQTLVDPITIDPFELFENELAQPIDHSQNQIEFPNATNSLSLHNFLDSYKPPDLYTTQVVPSQPSKIEKLGAVCECNSYGSPLRIKLSMKGYAILTCKTCLRQAHSCCYGIISSSSIKKTSSIFKCYSCIFETDVLDENLIMLMRLRYLWKYMSCYEIPDHFNFFYEIFNLNHGTDDAILRRLINRLFQDKMFMVLEKPIIVKANKRATGTGYMTPTIDNILDNNNHTLLKNNEYIIAFAPKVKTSKFICNFDKQSFYLPDVHNTKGHIIDLLQQFKLTLTIDHEYENDPIESSSLNFNQSFNKIVKSHIGTTQTYNKNSDDIDELSFEDSLNFLSQPQKNQDSQAINFLQDKVTQVHLLSNKRTLDGNDSSVERNNKNRKISVNEESCF